MENTKKFAIRVGRKDSRDLVVHYQDGEATIISFRPYDDAREKRRVENLISFVVFKCDGELTDAFPEGPHQVVRFWVPDVEKFRAKHELRAAA